MSHTQLDHGRSQNTKSYQRSQFRNQKKPPEHLDRSGVVVRMTLDEGSDTILVSFSGEDRTGLINYFAQFARQCGLNIDSGFTMRLKQRFSGTQFVIEGNREQIMQFQKLLKQSESDLIPGKQIFPAKLFEIDLEGDDRIGLLSDITCLLKEHNVNVVTMGLDTEEIIPDDYEIGSDTELVPLPKRVFINLRCEVPLEQLQFLNELEEQLSPFFKPGWRIKIKEWTRTPRHDPPDIPRSVDQN